MYIKIIRNICEIKNKKRNSKINKDIYVRWTK